MLPVGLFQNYLYDVVKVRFTRSPALRPLICTYYLTLRCNFRCSFCGFADGQETDTELQTDDVIRLLKIIRKSCPCIYFTGGEPLLRSDIGEILHACRSLGFESITLNTNLSLMDRRWDSLKYIDNLVVSLNQMDDEQVARTKEITVDAARQVRENLVKCLELRQKWGFGVVVNCVITPATIKDTSEVMEYCFKNKLKLAIVPAELDGGHLNKALVNDRDYKRIVKLAIDLKKAGFPIWNSYLYLRHILNAEPFTCCPTLMPHIYPSGNLFYPCQPTRKVAGNILDFGSYESCLQEGLRKNGGIPSCRDRCFIACYIETSMAIQHPWKYLLNAFTWR